MTVTTYKWSIDRYHQAVQAGVFEDQPVELLNGEIVVMPPEGEIHACRGDITVEYLRYLLGNRAQIREAKPITLHHNQSEPEPDIAIVEPRFWEYNEHHPYPENIHWTIEFANTSLKKDLETKDKIYATANIQEYWVINLKATELIVFRDPANGIYQSQQNYSSGSLSPLAFSDISITIDILLGKQRWIPGN
ncbi:Uma2 family endonuclease [filamentous cyanobacterium LEGE 11480]|uniref:Uma2 family endonuclease n=1 Tax=Romeriopsis navalis LEGE 11480 TaxID=2777977 RepID=A0A928Z6R7_9CYAN|nr:Uma2 family endonuclease [Romeriopsis navalis]MBE9032913.1 Uma2 family endonuclease [Romeriopsis navalis LEGE 11480]